MARNIFNYTELINRIRIHPDMFDTSIDHNLQTSNNVVTMATKMQNQDSTMNNMFHLSHFKLQTVIIALYVKVKYLMKTFFKNRKLSQLKYEI